MVADVALKCKTLLEQYGIVDIDIELRESDIIQYAGPRLLKPTVTLRESFTAMIGLMIRAKLTPWIEDTGGLFLEVDDGNGKKSLFLVTASLSTGRRVSHATTSSS